MKQSTKLVVDTDIEALTATLEYLDVTNAVPEPVMTPITTGFVHILRTVPVPMPEEFS